MRRWLTAGAVSVAAAGPGFGGDPDFTFTGACDPALGWFDSCPFGDDAFQNNWNSQAPTREELVFPGPKSGVFIPAPWIVTLLGTVEASCVVTAEGAGLSGGNLVVGILDCGSLSMAGGVYRINEHATIRALTFPRGTLEGPGNVACDTVEFGTGPFKFVRVPEMCANTVRLSSGQFGPLDLGPDTVMRIKEQLIIDTDQRIQGGLNSVIVIEPTAGVEKVAQSGASVMTTTALEYFGQSFLVNDDFSIAGGVLDGAPVAVAEGKTLIVNNTLVDNDVRGPGALELGFNNNIVRVGGDAIRIDVLVTRRSTINTIDGNLFVDERFIFPSGTVRGGDVGTLFVAGATEIGDTQINRTFEDLVVTLDGPVDWRTGQRWFLDATDLTVNDVVTIDDIAHELHLNGPLGENGTLEVGPEGRVVVASSLDVTHAGSGRAKIFGIWETIGVTDIDAAFETCAGAATRITGDAKFADVVAADDTWTIDAGATVTYTGDVSHRGTVWINHGAVASTPARAQAFSFSQGTNELSYGSCGSFFDDDLLFTETSVSGTGWELFFDGTAVDAVSTTFSGAGTLDARNGSSVELADVQACEMTLLSDDSSEFAITGLVTLDDSAVDAALRVFEDSVFGLEASEGRQSVIGGEIVAEPGSTFRVVGAVAFQSGLIELFDSSLVIGSDSVWTGAGQLRLSGATVEAPDDDPLALPDEAFSLEFIAGANVISAALDSAGVATVSGAGTVVEVSARPFTVGTLRLLDESVVRMTGTDGCIGAVEGDGQLRVLGVRLDVLRAQMKGFEADAGSDVTAEDLLLGVLGIFRVDGGGGAPGDAGPPSEVHVLRRFDFEMTDATSWFWGPDAVLSLDGGVGAEEGAWDEWTRLEVGGADLGTDPDAHEGDPAGFDDNFDLSVLRVGPGARALLADAIDNGHRDGPFGAAEALYVDVLEFADADARLNLNGVHLYFGALVGDPGQIIDVPIDRPGDVDGDGDVDFGDLLDLLAAWGPCPPPPAACPADLDDDGDVDFGDLLVVLANWD